MDSTGQVGERVGTPAWRKQAVLLLGAAIAGLGLVALLGWLLDIPRWSGFSAGMIPMAPSTAILFVVHGVALALRVLPRTTRRARLMHWLLGSAATVAAVLLVLSALGIRSPVEHLGMTIAGELHGTPLGYISPVTAACFLLASAASVPSLAMASTTSWRRLGALALAGLLLGTSLVFLLAYLYGSPLLYGIGFIPPAINTTLAFLMLAAGVLLSAGVQVGLSSAAHPTTRESGWLILLFIVFAAGLIAAGHYYYHVFERHQREEITRQLSAIADLKVAELVQWRQERLGDGRVFLGNKEFSGLAERCIEAPGDATCRARLATWLDRLREAFRYDRVFVVDAGAREVVSSPGDPAPVARHLEETLAAHLASRQVTMLDFHRDTPTSPIHLSVLVPLHRVADGAPFGLLALRIDPAAKLYPIVGRWPIASRTAETLLVRREGEDVVFLNPLRFRKDAALSLRLPLASPRLPAARAAGGAEGFFEGVDYRGGDVVAVLRKVPDSPWSLVARMDAAEVFEPLRERLWLMALLVAGLLLAAGAALSVVWRQHSMRFYRERYEAAEALRASEARYRTLMEHSPVGVFINRQDRVIEANQACLRLFGASSKDELLGKSPFELFHPDCHGTIRERIRMLRELGRPVPLVEERIVRLDGTPVEVEVTAAPFQDRGVNAIHVVLSDITERKAAERALRASETELRQRNDELTRFTYTVSHDLKSPLVTIQTFVGYLEQDLVKPDAAAVAKDFGFIRGAATKMSLLLDELLELSRIGRIGNPMVDASLASVVDDALALVAGRLATRGVHVDVRDEPVILHGDRPRLVEVFQNLLDNAAKFMGQQPSPRIEIGAEETHGELALFVRDNGDGIDPRHTHKLFGLFEKLDPKSEGTGIGLALVRRIVEVHGGRIWVESGGLGQGAYFRFTLNGLRRVPRKDAL